MSTTNNTALVILSCDKYADIWPPFFTFLFKYWPQCPYRIYLGSNVLEFEDKRVVTIQSGPALDWSRDTISILEQIPEKNVIILLEDYFLMRPVDEKWLTDCIRLVESKNAEYMRIASFPYRYFPYYAYDPLEDAPFAGITRKSAHYFISLQAGIWNRKALIDLIVPGESPWDFEIRGSERARTRPGVFLGIIIDKKATYVHGPIPYLCTAITRGMWTYEAVALGHTEKIFIDTKNRRIESWLAYQSRELYGKTPLWMRKPLDYIGSRIFKRPY